MANSLEAKIVVLGSQGVGKTSLVHRYVKNAFTPPTTQSTVGASFLTKRVVDIDTSTIVRLQIWDTAGQERFRSISKLYYRGTFESHTLHTSGHESVPNSSDPPPAPFFFHAQCSLHVLFFYRVIPDYCPSAKLGLPSPWSELSRCRATYTQGNWKSD